MFLAKAKPTEILDWFMSGRANLDILCLLLAPTSRDRDRIRAIVDDSFAFDAFMGFHVGFLLMYPGQRNALGLGHGSARDVFPGETLVRNLRDARAEITEFCDQDFYGKMASDIAEQMAYFVPDFMGLLGVSSGSLPCLCVLVYGENDFKTIPLGADWTTEQFGRWLVEIAKLVDRQDTASIRPAYLLEQYKKMEREVAEAESIIKTRIAKMVERFENLDRKYGMNESDKLAVARFLQADQIRQAELESLLRNLSVVASPRFLTDNNNVPALHKLVREVEGLQSRIVEAFETGALPLESIPEILDRQMRRSGEIRQKLNDLKLPGSATRRLAQSYERFDQLTAYVSKTHEALKRFAFLAPLLARLSKYVGL